MYRVIYSKENSKWLPESIAKSEGYKGKTYTALADASEVAEKRNAGTTVECKECHRPFAILPEEAEWYTKEKGYDLPKRCPSCRRKRRKKAEEESETKE